VAVDAPLAVQPDRRQNGPCPIVVLAAQVRPGLVDEADIAAAMNNFDLVFSEKPVRCPSFRPPSPAASLPARPGSAG
jgi:hypothetical protein